MTKKPVSADAPPANEKMTTSMRLPRALKAKLDNVVRESGRSLSQEVEMRLEQSFAQQSLLPQILELAYGRQATGLLLIIARAMSHTGSHCAFSKSFTLEAAENWMSDAYAYGQIRQAIDRILDAFQPTGPVELPKPIGLGVPDVRMEMGRGFAAGILNQVATPFETGVVGFRTEAAKIHELLGHLADKEPKT